jgi:hypothetical protein
VCVCVCCGVVEWLCFVVCGSGFCGVVLVGLWLFVVLCAVCGGVVWCWLLLFVSCVLWCVV